MYMPGRWRMWAVSLKIWTLSGTYWIDASAVACSSLVSGVSTTPMFSSLMVFSLTAAPWREGGFLSLVSVQHPGAEAQVGQGGAGQAPPQLFEQAALMKM